MNRKPLLLSAACAAIAGFAAGGYATYAGLAWSRYGQPARARPDERDELLDRFMPVFDVVERHHIDVLAPAATTLAAARALDLSAMPLVNAIFKGREVILGASPGDRPRVAGLVDEVLAMGWVILAEVPDRAIVIGAVTQPWEANVVFRSVPPEAFAAFNEPGYVKIAWTLRADPVDAERSVFRTETRAVATDAGARTKFRCYWSLFSPGIELIRRMTLRPVKRAAESQRYAHAR